MDEQKNYYAHKDDNGNLQLLKDHLIGAAELAKENSLPAYGNCAYFTGLMHDIGKYQLSFQKRLFGSPIKVEHSISGAKEIEKIICGKSGEPIRRLFQYVIAGHHSGIPDYGTESDGNDSPTLLGRLKREGEDYSAYSGEIEEELKKAESGLSAELASVFSSYCNLNELRDRYEFFVRYLFSCFALLAVTLRKECVS